MNGLMFLHGIYRRHLNEAVYSTELSQCNSAKHSLQGLVVRTARNQKSGHADEDGFGAISLSTFKRTTFPVCATTGFGE